MYYAAGAAIGYISTTQTNKANQRATEAQLQASQEATDAQTAASKAGQETMWNMFRQTRADTLPWLKAGEEALAQLTGGSYYTMDRPEEQFVEVLMTDGSRRKLIRNYKDDPTYKSASPELQRQMDLEAQKIARINKKAEQKYEASKVTIPTGLIEEGPGSFEKSPYYQLGLDEQQEATDAYMASRGLYGSGKAGKAYQANALDNLSRNRGNWLNEWIATKLNPTQAVAGAGQTAAVNIGSQGQATGAGVAGMQVGAGNAFAQGAYAGGGARSTGYINQANINTNALQSGMNALGRYYGNQTTPPAGNFQTGPQTWTGSQEGYWDYMN